jgi:hypothetical protein
MKASGPRRPLKRGMKATMEACKDRTETETLLDELSVWMRPADSNTGEKAADQTQPRPPRELSVEYDEWFIQRGRQYNWDSEQRRRAESMGKRLGREPEIAHRMESSLQGSLWLSRRWEELGAALVEKGRWTKLQRRLAFNLLGVSKIFRDTSQAVPPEHDRASLANLVQRELERHRERREKYLNRRDSYERESWLGIRDLEALNHLPLWYFRVPLRYQQRYRYRKHRQ